MKHFLQILLIIILCLIALPFALVGGVMIGLVYFIIKVIQLPIWVVMDIVEAWYE